MSDLPTLIKDWLPSVASLATLATVARVAWLSRSYFEDLATARRVGILVEGDRTEQNDAKKRYGLAGRFETSENVTERLALYMKSVLRGMNLPSDWSNADELEAMVAERMQRMPGGVDRLAARTAIVEGQAKAHKERPSSGGKRFSEHRPALDGRRTPALEAPHENSWQRATGRREPPIDRNEPPDSGEDDGQ